MHRPTKMAKINKYRRLIIVQVFFLVISILSIEVDGKLWDNVSKMTGTVVRSVGRATSKVFDGSQYMTQKLAGTVRKVKPLKSIADSAGGTASNVLGATSRFLGKNVKEPPRVQFLYKRPINRYGNSKTYIDAMKTVIGYALTNVVLHADDMDVAGPGMVEMPVLQNVIWEISHAGANKNEIEVIIEILGRNGHKDLPEELRQTVLQIMKHPNGSFRKTGLMEELYWISDHLKGFRKLNENEMTDYKMSTKKKYKGCTFIQPLNFENTDTN